MNLRKRVITVVFLAATVLGAPGAPAMAVPMPWEASKVPAVTVQCGTSCYEQALAQRTSAN